MKPDINNEKTLKATPLSRCFVDKCDFNVFEWHILHAREGDLEKIFGPGFNSSLRKDKVRSHRRTFVSRKGAETKFSLSASYIPDKKAISITMRVHLNGNRLLRQYFETAGQGMAVIESLDGNDNCLPLNLLQSDTESNRNKQIEIVAQRLDSLIGAIAQSIRQKFIRPALQLNSPTLSVSSIELNHDFYQTNARAFVVEQRESFHRKVKDSLQDEYCVLRTEWSNNCMCLSGEVVKGLRAKLYPKTANTVRFELGFSGYRIRAIVGRNVVEGPTSKGLSQMVEQLERSTQKLADDFITLESCDDGSVDVLQVFCQLYDAVHDTENLKFLLTMYSISGVVHYQEPYRKLIEQLCRKQILLRTSPGVYSFANWSRKVAERMRDILRKSGDA